MFSRFFKANSSNPQLPNPQLPNPIAVASIPQPVAGPKPHTMRQALFILAQAKHLAHTQPDNNELAELVNNVEQALINSTEVFFEKEFEILEKDINRNQLYANSGGIAAEEDCDEGFYYVKGSPEVELDLSQSIMLDDELLNQIRQATSELQQSEINKSVAEQKSVKIAIQKDPNTTLCEFYKKNIQNAQEIYGDSIQNKLDESQFLAVTVAKHEAVFQNLDKNFFHINIENSDLRKLEDFCKKEENKWLSNIYSSYQELVSVIEKASQNFIPEALLIQYQKIAQNYIKLCLRDESEKKQYTTALAASITATAKVDQFLNFTVNDFLMLTANPFEIISHLNEKLHKVNLSSKFALLEKVIIHYNLLNSLLNRLLAHLKKNPPKNTEQYGQFVQAAQNLINYFNFQFTRPSRFVMVMGAFAEAIDKPENNFVDNEQLQTLQNYIQDLKGHNFIINATQTAKEYVDELEKIISKKEKLPPGLIFALKKLHSILTRYLADKINNPLSIAEYNRLTEEIAIVMAQREASYSSKNLSEIGTKAHGLVESIVGTYYTKAREMHEIQNPRAANQAASAPSQLDRSFLATI
jgi:hypothetical protein